ncbi:MAG: hypothetical protein KME45_00805 [Stenomitos rutilans HA7619-LM2]|jgi:hypothetical protein|nr:hypothetical protein [Stenomitos rutilans HA7619-LM2]
MLKLTYIEDGLHLERMAAPLEVLIAQRVLLALRAGQKLYVEPSKAAFLLPADAFGLSYLELTLKRDRVQNITVAPVDDAFVEVSLQGSWLAEGVDAHEGMFLTAFSDRAEFFVHKLWQATQVHASSLAIGDGR